MVNNKRIFGRSGENDRQSHFIVPGKLICSFAHPEGPVVKLIDSPMSDLEPEWGVQETELDSTVVSPP